MFIETSLRPFPNNVSRQSSDQSSGIHNYLHSRFQDGNSDLNMGDPEVNIENQLFWKLQGWIDSRWSTYRTTSGRSDSAPKYLEALTKAEQHMAIPSSVVDGGLKPFGAAPWNLEDHMHSPITVPDDIKEMILDSVFPFNL